MEIIPEIKENVKEIKEFKLKSLRQKLGQRFYLQALDVLKQDTEESYEKSKKLFRKSRNADECGSFLEFSICENVETLEKKGKLKKADFCKIKWCHTCSCLKSKKVVRELRSICQQIENSYKDKKLTYLFLTLALKNPPLNELRSTIEKMSLAFKEMFKKEKLYDKHILGYFRSIEFLGDKTMPGYAHPHFHVILVVDSGYFGNYYISQQKWIDMWQKYLKVDYKPTAHVQRIKANSKKKMEAKDSAVYEVAKYSVSPATFLRLSQKDFEMLDKETKGVRQYNKGGVFKDFKPIEEEDDLDNTELWREIDKIYFYWRQELDEYEASKI